VKVAERLAALIAHPGLPGVFAVNGGPAPENTTAEIRQLSPSLVIIVDAADMGGPAGTVRVLDPGAVSAASFGTHGLALGVLADYLRAEMKCRVILIGIQPASVEHGEMLSEEVSTAVNELVDALRECLA
jgi:hydrogenase 3 maturation protease